MSRISLTELVVSVVGETKQLLNDLKELELAKEKALASNDSSGLQRALDQLATSAQGANRTLDPLARTSKTAASEMRELSMAVKAGLIPVGDGVKRYRELETSLKSQLGTLQKGSSEYTALSRTMKTAGEEARRLEQIQKSTGASFKTDDLKRYETALRDIQTAQKAGLTSQKDAATQYRSLQGSLAQQLGTLKQGSAEYRGLAGVMSQAGEAAKKLEAQQDKLEASFRADFLKQYAGELRSIDVAVRSGTSGFDDGVRQVQRLSDELRSQQGELGQTGKEFDQLSRLLQAAAQQQERYQQAAQSAARSNDASQVRAFGQELKQLESSLRSTTTEAGRLDAQQRAIRYDSAGVRAYRTEAEGLSTSFGRIGQGLGDLQGRLQTYARGLSEGSREHAELTRVIESTQKATLSLTQQQERAAAAYRAADLSRFTTELKSIEQAQKAGLISSEQAARAVTALEADFKSYAASLNVTERELGTFARAQTDAGRGADQLAQAQERAQRAFDGRALQGFRSELEQVVRAQQGGSQNFEQMARAVESVQGRLREYGSTLAAGSREQQDLNKLLELSGRALTTLGTAAERAGKGFDPAPVTRYAGELANLEQAQRDLAQGVELLEAAQRRSQDAFKGAELDRFRGELEAVSRALKTGSGDFEVLARAAGSTQQELQDYLSTLEKGSQEHTDLNRVLQTTGTALKTLATEAERAGQGFDPRPVRDFAGELDKLEGTGRELGQNFDQIQRELDELDGSLRASGDGAQLSAREQQALGGVMRELEGATTRLAQANEKAQASFKSDQLRAFRSDLEQITTAQKNGVVGFEATGRAVEALQGRMQQFGSSAQLSARETQELAKIMGSAETAVRNLTSAQERVDAAFHTDNIRQYNAALADLKLAHERGETSQEQFVASAREIGTALEQARSSVERSSTAFGGYTQALTRVNSSVAQAEGKVRTFGVASSVTAGIGDQLSSVLYALGPAGEAMGVAMSAASSGMAGAATSAKLLNVALAVGVVGAVIGLAVGAAALVKGMATLDTGLTDVAKTTGFTQTELNGLAKELNNIALATGTPIEELTGLASVAGSLGVTGVDNVAAFTDTLNKLAIATDIVGDAGAEQLAKFINVTKDASQTVGESAELVGNVIVRLGNDLAATEAPILAMASRLGGLKTSAGLSQVDILALSGAFVSVGFTAEGASTPLINLINKISQAGKEGGPALTSLAKGAGMTTEEFQKLAKASPAEAFQAYIKGLKEADGAGQNIVPTIKEITKENTGMLDIVTRAVGGFDTLSLSFESARDEAERMTAMNNELQTRLGSLEGTTKLITATFKFFTTQLQLALIPVLKDVLNGVLDFSRGILGLEPAMGRANTFLTGAGESVGVFAKALTSGTTESKTFAASVGVNFAKTADVLNRVNDAFVNAGARHGEYVRGLLGLSTESSRTADSLERTGASAILGANGLDALRKQSETAATGMATLDKAAGKQGLLASVETLETTLTGPGKQAFVLFAQQAIASGNDIGEIADLIEKRYTDARIAMLKAQQDSLKPAIEQALERQTQAYRDAGSEQMAAARLAIANDQALLSSLEQRRAKGEMVSDEEIANINANIVKNQEWLRELNVVYATHSERLAKADGEVNRLTDSNNALTRQIQDLGKEKGPTQVAGTMQATEVATFRAGTALEEYNAVSARFADLSTLNSDEAQVFLDRLLKLKEGYQGNRAEINEMIVATRARIEAAKENAQSTEEEAAAQQAAADAAKALEEAQTQVADATTLLGRGSAVTSDELFSMAMSLGEAAARTDETGAAARQLQTDLVNAAVKMDMASRAAEAWASEQERQQGVVDGLKERLGGLAESALAIISPFGDVNRSLQEIEFQARAFGNTATVAEDKAAVWRAEMERLAAEGEEGGLAYNRAAANYRIWTTEVERAEAAAKTWADEVERQERVVETLKGNLLGLADGFRSNIVPVIDLQRGLTEIDTKARLFGDSSSVAADKAALWAGEMERLTQAGRANTDEFARAEANYRNYAQQVADAEAATEALAFAQEIAGDATLKLADVTDASGKKLSDYAIIMTALGEANEQAETSFAGVGSEAEQLEAKISNTERAIAAATEKYGANSRTVEELQNNLLGYKTRLGELTKEEEKASKAADELKEAQETLKDVQEGNVEVSYENANALREQADELIKNAGGYKQLGSDAKTAVDDLRRAADEMDRTRLLSGLLGGALGVVSDAFRGMGESLRNSGSQEELDELIEKRDELLEGGDYNPAAIKALNADIAELRETIGDEQMWAGVFEGLGSGVETFTQLWEDGANVVVAAIAGIGTALSQLSDEIGGVDEVSKQGIESIGNIVTATATGFATGGPIGAAIGFGLGLLTGIVDMFGAQAREAEQAEDAVKKYGAQVLINNGILELTARGYVLNEEKLAEYKQGLADAEQAQKDAAAAAAELAEKQRELQEELRKSREELRSMAQQAKQDLNDLNQSVEESRLEFAKTNGADEGLVFISETILGLREQSAEFNAEMQSITAQKNEYIKQYMEANPGAGLAEATAAAEKIFGPQRDALKEQFALTAATTLTGAAEQAKALGLSQEEFYTAVLSGNTELLGNMTEGQRQAMVQIIQLMQELGLEIPKALQDAIGNVEAAQAESGAALAESQGKSTEAQVAAIQAEQDQLKTAFLIRSDTLKALIRDSSGAEQQMYKDMLAAETSAFTAAYTEKTNEINAIQSDNTNKSLEQLKADREATKRAYEERRAELVASIEGASLAEVGAIRQNIRDLDAAYAEADAEHIAAINEGSDGVGSAMEADAQRQVDAINAEIATLNTAWAERSAQLKNLIATTTGDAQAEYKRMYEQESAAYEQSRADLAADQQQANQALLDAQDKGSADWIAAQEEIGKRERESLGGIYEQLRAILGPDADLIISMIENTYNRRREAYLADGAATADAAAQANQGELDQLSSIYEQLRAILGPDADIIISMIEGTYEKRQAAYASGGDAAANAAATSAEAERQSIANVNQILRDIFGPEAQGIIDQILALYDKRAKAYESGGNGAATAAQASAETERQSIANINQLLRDIFGPEAQGIIDQILALYNKREQAYREGGEGAAAGATEGSEAEATAQEQGTERTTGAIADSDARTQAALDARTKNVAGKLLADGGIADLITSNSNAFFKNFQDGGTLAAQGIDGSTKQIDGSLVTRDTLLRGALGKEATISQEALTAAAGLGNAFTQGGQTAYQAIAGATGLLTGGLGTRVEQVNAQLQREKELEAIARAQATGLGGAFADGGKIAVGAVDAATRDLLAGLSGQGSQVGGSISSTYSAMNAAQQTGVSGFNSAILSGGSTLQGSLNTTFSGISAIFSGGAGGYANVITSGFGNLGNVFNQGSVTLVGAVQRTGQGVASSTQASYAAMNAAQTQGSNSYQASIREKYQAEQQMFQAQSAVLLDRIAKAKGAERDRLIAEYNQLQAQHAAKSRDYEAAIKDAARGEEGAISDGTRVVTGALGDFGKDTAQAAKDAIDKARKEHEARAKEYAQKIKDAATDIGNKVDDSGDTVGGKYTSAVNAILPKLDGFFTKQGTNIGTGAKKVISALDTNRSLIESALGKLSDLIKNYDFPNFPTPPTPPAVTVAGWAEDLASTQMSFAPPEVTTAGAFAADGLPDYRGATGSVRAYAAATGTLLDLFDTQGSLNMTSRQERALAVTISFDSLRGALSTPITMLERVADQMWQAVRFERETATYNRETAELWRSNVSREATTPGAKHQRRRRR